jgi:hypothetical protein
MRSGTINQDDNSCPVCSEITIDICRCILKDSRCKNGHYWHRCVVHNKKVIGFGDHGKSTDACHCDDGD